MRAYLRNLPIARKLTVICMVVTGIALLLTYASLTVFEIVTFRAGMVEDHQSIAGILGDNSASALAFNDPASAALTLHSAAAHAHVVDAVIYDKGGKVFATYRSADATGVFIP